MNSFLGYFKELFYALFILILLQFSPHWVLAQTEIEIPARTKINCVFNSLVTRNDKPGTPVTAEVEKDVLVNGVVVIAKGAPVEAKIRTNNKPKKTYYSQDELSGELVIDVYSTVAVDGSVVKFNDCYLQTFNNKNYDWFAKNAKTVLQPNSFKICETPLPMKVKIK
jgi:hypothetical protein